MLMACMEATEPIPPLFIKACAAEERRPACAGGGSEEAREP